VRGEDRRQPGSWELAREPDDLSGSAVPFNFPEGSFFRGVRLGQSGAVVSQGWKLGRAEWQRPQADQLSESQPVNPTTAMSSQGESTSKPGSGQSTKPVRVCFVPGARFPNLSHIRASAGGLDEPLTGL
jgi:hypothetical protein